MGKHNYWLGKKRTEHSLKMKGHKVSEETKNKIRESCRNCPVVHHINGNHFDDRPENRIILTPREHAIIHMLRGDLHNVNKGGKN